MRCRILLTALAVAVPLGSSSAQLWNPLETVPRPATAIVPRQIEARTLVDVAVQVLRREGFKIATADAKSGTVTTEWSTIGAVESKAAPRQTRLKVTLDSGRRRLTLSWADRTPRDKWARNYESDRRRADNLLRKVVKELGPIRTSPPGEARHIPHPTDV